MRVTVHVPDQLGQQAKEMARSEAISVSRLFAEALERYIEETRRRELGRAVLAIAGKVKVADDVYDVLEAERADAGS